MFNLLLHLWTPSPNCIFFPGLPLELVLITVSLSLNEKEAGRFVSLMHTFDVQLLIFTILPRHRNNVFAHWAAPPPTTISTFSLTLWGFRACSSHYILLFVTLYNIVFVYLTSVIWQSAPSIPCRLHTKNTVRILMLKRKYFTHNDFRRVFLQEQQAISSAGWCF